LRRGDSQADCPYHITIGDFLMGKTQEESMPKENCWEWDENGNKSEEMEKKRGKAGKQKEG
jgi:hypothetical protein